MLDRHTNRHVVFASPFPSMTGRLDILRSVAEHNGARLVIVDDRDRIDRIADIVAESDRIRCLTPRLHAEMVSELRWPDDDHQETGIDVNGLEVGQAGLQAMEILRRPEVMAQLARLERRTGSGRRRPRPAQREFGVGRAVDVGCGESGRLCPGRVSPRGGVGGRSAARCRGSSVVGGFSLPAAPSEFRDLAPEFAPMLARLQQAFRRLIGLAPVGV